MKGNEGTQRSVNRVRPWTRVILRIASRLVIGTFVLITAAFLLIQLTPGDPIQRILGPIATEADIERVREDLGLSDPIAERYVNYLGDAARLDFGESFRTGRPVFTILTEKAPPTIQLATAGVVIALLLSIPGGLLVASLTNHQQRAPLDAAFTAGTGLLAAIPPYVLAVILVAVFAVTLQWFPIAGAESQSAIVLPALAAGLPFAAVLVRVIRVEALTALQSDYARTVRSKRLPARTLYIKHLLPNVLTGTLSISGVFFGYLLAGSVVVESVFAWPGLGTELATAITNRDYPLLQGAVLFLGILVLIVNSGVDLILTSLDPRVRAAAN